jgi:tRNA 2-thiouridine synthesizing protein A
MSMSNEMFLDVRGLACPLPVLRAKKTLKTMDVGAVLRVEATDPNSVKDMAAFCVQTGNQLVESTSADGIYIFLIRRTA